MITERFTGEEHAGFRTLPPTANNINMAKLMAVAIAAYVAVPVLVFFAADRAFDSNWSGVLGFLLDAAGCVIVARMITWASRNL